MSEESLDKPDQPKGWGVFAGTFWAGVAFLGPQLLVIPFIPLIHTLVASANMRLFVVQSFVQLVTFVIIALVIRGYKLDLKSIGLKRTRITDLILAVVAFPAYLVASILFTQLVSVFYPVDLEQQQAIGFATPNAIELALVFVALVIVTPIVEEVIFRGFLFKAYVRTFGLPVAAVLVSLVFAVAHGQLNVALDTFILSLFLCYLRFSTGSLWPSILLHAVKNFVAFYVLFIIGAE